MLYIGPDIFTQEEKVTLLVCGAIGCATITSLPPQAHAGYVLLTGRDTIHISLIDKNIPVLVRIVTENDVAYCTINQYPGTCLLTDHDYAVFVKNGDLFTYRGVKYKVPKQGNRYSISELEFADDNVVEMD